MNLSVFRILLLFALLGAVSATISCGCKPRPPSYCCWGRYGRCCMARKKRDVASNDFMPLEGRKPVDFKFFEE
ncbi:hypothetical protein Y032_0077g1116 [Ancylostoma ceylanicum]|uniref:Uncharacterized protein n=1 Tax=Ancylostoma ceylanicum TaxID=53326 RepID=A0A016TTZ0_9BILA|nr:hypothetical protein Y032_0077g1116 [Ancylostoma ceylanicum]